MHINHDVFLEGLDQSKRVLLTFFSEKQGRNVVTQCAPLHFSEGRARGDKLECYYFWDFGTEPHGGFLPLPESEIIAIESTDQDFRVGEIIKLSKAGKRSRHSDQRAVGSPGSSESKE